MAKKLTEERKNQIDEQIISLSIPYDYDTAEIPLSVVVQRFELSKNNDNKELLSSIFIPEYQRKFVWDTKRQSRFIESIYLGVPIPSIFCADIKGNFEIIDGAQRIRTVSAYYNNELRLRKLEKLTELNGTYFNQLNSIRQRKFSNFSLRFHIVTERADIEIRQDIFDRLNTGSSQLTANELRKGAFNGPFFNFVQDVSSSSEFNLAFPNRNRTKISRGEQDELVLRFFAYSDYYKDVRHDVKLFLDKYVKEMNQRFSENTQLLEDYRRRINRVIDFVINKFPNGSIARINKPNSTPRVRFEAISIGLHLALEEKPNLLIKDFSWLESEEFRRETTSDASNNPGRLSSRIEFVRNVLLKQ